MASAATFFTDEQKKAIRVAIVRAELNTSGEIRVHVDEHCKGEVMEQAAKIFHKLRMHITEQRNAVLFYLAVKDKKFAILGDEGLDRKVPPGFWNAIRDKMESHFKEGRFAEGLIAGVTDAGLQLKEHFPRMDDDRNELSNDVTFNEQ